MVQLYILYLIYSEVLYSIIQSYTALYNYILYSTVMHFIVQRRQVGSYNHRCSPSQNFVLEYIVFEYLYILILCFKLKLKIQV